MRPDLLEAAGGCEGGGEEGAVLCPLSTMELIGVHSRHLVVGAWYWRRHLGVSEEQRILSYA